MTSRVTRSAPNATMAVVAAETATVYRGGSRRYFTKLAAIKGHAKAKFRQKHPCECEAMDYAAQYPGYNCHVHDLWERVGPRYVRFLRFVARRIKST